MPGQAYFITKCALDRVLTTDDCAELVIASFLWARDNAWWRILGFVVMPDHYHLAICLLGTKTLSEVLHSISRFTANRINANLGRSGPVWEEGFYDHAIRDRVDFDGILAYMHDNPVKAVLTEAADSWPYSTANPRYAQEIEWEWLDPSMPKIVPGAARFQEHMIPPRFR